MEDENWIRHIISESVRTLFAKTINISPCLSKLQLGKVSAFFSYFHLHVIYIINSTPVFFFNQSMLPKHCRNYSAAQSWRVLRHSVEDRYSAVIVKLLVSNSRSAFRHN